MQDLNPNGNATRHNLILSAGEYSTETFTSQQDSSFIYSIIISIHDTMPDSLSRLCLLEFVLRC